MSGNRAKDKRNPVAVTQEQVADDFDQITDEYEAKINKAIAIGGREHEFYIAVKRDHILQLVSAQFGNIGDLDVLDLGCGIGAYHAGLSDRFRQLHGIDVSTKSIDFAKNRYPDVLYSSYDGDALPYEDGKFDVVFTVCVMHHVPVAKWNGFTAEILRVLKPGGLALVFEHNPYNPATQYIVKSCDIDKDAVLLRPATSRKLFERSGFQSIKTRTILTVPPVNRILTRVDAVLGGLPFGAQYYLSATKPD